MNRHNPLGYIHPLAGSSIFHLLNLYFKSGGVDRLYLAKILLISVMSLLTTPLIILEKIRFERRITRTKIEDSPIFIVGHWRSGTTYLHNLLNCDSQFGYLNTLQSFRASEIYLIARKAIERVAKKQFPMERPMDRVKITADSPQEEEFALANSSTYSFYHGFYFPQQMWQLFNRFVLLDRQSEPIKEKWKKLYWRQLQKMTLSSGNKRLIIKNPVNTARIKLLLELFPKAKFIHIYRDPHIVYVSTKRMYQKMIDTWGLQDISEVAISENILYFYRAMMQEYLRAKTAIPTQSLIEIKYEHFIGCELEYLAYIYQQFDLSNWEEVQQQFQLYLQSQSEYRRNNYQLDNKTVSLIKSHWQFALQEWQYSI
ncbi:MAG: sulfotransferase [Cyanophyceae cyanobacterium]